MKGRGRSSRTIGTAVVTTMAVLTGLMGWLQSPLPAGAVVPPSTKTVSLDATFSSNGQSLWGPGGAAPPATQSFELFDETWNASATGGHIESVDLNWSYEARASPNSGKTATTPSTSATSATSVPRAPPPPAGASACRSCSKG